MNVYILSDLKDVEDFEGYFKAASKSCKPVLLQ